MRYLDPLHKLTVLYVDGDHGARVEVCDWLEGLFADILVAGSVSEAMRVTEGVEVHALISEIRLPDPGGETRPPARAGADPEGNGAPGVALVEGLRARFPGLPVIFISASTAPEDLLAAIKVRPVDYLPKPLAWSAVKAALRRLVDHLSARDQVVVRLGNGAYYCTRDGTVNCDGQMLCLTKQEQRLIETLIARQGHWVHTERLLQVVYDDPDRASESGLKSLIMRLRRKVGREVIVNGYGSGYRLQLAQRDS